MDQILVYTTAAVIAGLVLSQVFRKSFDPFAPLWLFLIGYFQIYVIQAISYREYSVRVRGLDLVTQANGRVLWALLWFLLVYHCKLGRMLASKLPKAPTHWSPGIVGAISPPMIAWGLICSGVLMAQSQESVSAQENILRQFPILMMIAGVLLIVTGRQPDRPRPAMTWIGVAVTGSYSLIWMFNGKRSHSLIGVLTLVCAFYLPRGKRPSIAVLGATALAGVLAVTLALGWRNNPRYERSPAGFFQYVVEFRPEMVLVNLNLKEREGVDARVAEQISKESEEYCAYLLMFDTVPGKADYDYGESYLRIVSTFIPRVLWADKPFYGRQQWANAWIAGSEFHRDASFTGPAIGIMGATQLNGGAVGTVVVMAVLAIMLRTAYEYYRRFAHTPWAQAWWAVTFYNAWLMTANDDPFVWFYYIYGFTTMPPVILSWLYLRVSAPQAAPERWAPTLGHWPT